MFANKFVLISMKRIFASINSFAFIFAIVLIKYDVYNF